MGFGGGREAFVSDEVSGQQAHEQSLCDAQIDGQESRVVGTFDKVVWLSGLFDRTGCMAEQVVWLSRLLD